ncbi:MAG: NmrA/HSCARG family protein [Sphingomicrobium sp.]
MSGLVLVTGATGTQGGAVTRTLLARGVPVRALVRNPASSAAQQLHASGATLTTGDFDDLSSLAKASEGVEAVFSVQQAAFADDPDRERRQARALISAARVAGVRHFVQTSVSSAADFLTMTGWAERRWEPNYWQSKGDVEDAARAAGFPILTILRPAFMMDNFAIPKAGWMFPDLSNREILTAVEPGTRVPLIAADDIGAAVVLALNEPKRFDGALSELAGDWLTLTEVAAIIGEVKCVTINVRTLPPAELIMRGQHAGWVESQQWQNVVGYPARPEMMVALGLAPTRFADWAAAHADEIEVS